MVAITKFQREDIFTAVRLMYTDVASNPGKTFHFPTGRAACEFLGYNPAQLDSLPGEAVASFAGVGCPLAAGKLPEGARVLDVGSGSGTDTLLAASQVGPDGRVYGLDLTRAMLQKLAANAGLMGVTNVEPLEGNVEEIPLPDGSIDIVISNGVINLVPDKPAAFRELNRVLQPGGRLQICDIAIGKDIDLIEEAREMTWLWAECIVGAISEVNYRQFLEGASFRNIRLHTRQDYFSKSANDRTRNVAEAFDAHSVIVEAEKPE
ncbi:MAG: methyltransferase domain-containing protein [Halobacteria archaeon]|nr:methyltransferase domain-containing protein [Halobacteria archaeon]